MSDDKDDFRLRPGRIRRARSGKPKTFLNEVLRAAKKAGSHSTVSIGGTGVAIGRSTFGRGRNVFGRSRISGSSRRVTIKTRITRQQGKAYRSIALPKHLHYLKREGVTRDGDRAEMFDAAGDQANESAFVERGKDDRHHFRFIIAPEDAAEMEDLRSFTRDLARQMEKDLRTKLDWVAVDHWNTDNPHVHLLVRGVPETDENISTWTPPNLAAASMSTMVPLDQDELDRRRAAVARFDYANVAARKNKINNQLFLRGVEKGEACLRLTRRRLSYSTGSFFPPEEAATELARRIAARRGYTSIGLAVGMADLIDGSDPLFDEKRASFIEGVLDGIQS